jgi:prenyl protein peptidase
MNQSLFDNVIHRDCNHVELTMKQAVSYCFALSVIFVGALYANPKRIRILERNDVRQIKWRSLTTSIVCVGSLVSYPFLFCTQRSEDPFWAPSLLDIQRDVKAVSLVLTHTAILYFGPLLQTAVELYTAMKRDGPFSFAEYITALYKTYIRPIGWSVNSPLNASKRWVRLRNIVIAPFAEEIVFRACMVPALCSTGLDKLYVALLAPLFFGVAHAHHAVVRVRNGERLLVVVIQTVFQFIYTFLFGSYASYAYVQTGSLLAVALSHSFCNIMGMPNLSFLGRSSHEYGLRASLSALHLAGVLAFATSFSCLVPARDTA